MDLSTTEEIGPVDGRTARRDRNRDAVLDAVLDLFSEDCLAPAAREVAARSGVSLRSVYRYYEDLDELARAAIARNVERTAPLLEVDGLGVGPLEDRVERIVTARLELHSAMAPTMRAALLRAHGNEIIGEQLGRVRDRLRQQAEDMFHPELSAMPARERRRVAAVLDLLLAFESLEHLRRHRGFSLAETRRSLTVAVAAVLGANG